MKKTVVEVWSQTLNSWKSPISNHTCQLWGTFGKYFKKYDFKISQIAETPWIDIDLTSIQHFVLDRCQIDVDPRVFAICDGCGVLSDMLAGYRYNHSSSSVDRCGLKSADDADVNYMTSWVACHDYGQVYSEVISSISTGFLFLIGFPNVKNTWAFPVLMDYWCVMLIHIIALGQNGSILQIVFFNCTF